MTNKASTVIWGAVSALFVLLNVLLAVGIPAAVLYVAFHFARKLW